jgi:outer membrane protein OmpA-like peptidoglycan-associated protein
MEQATLETGVQVTQASVNRLKRAIPSDISFDINRTDIKPDLRPVLDRFGNCSGLMKSDTLMGAHSR